MSAWERPGSLMRASVLPVHVWRLARREFLSPDRRFAPGHSASTSSGRRPKWASATIEWEPQVGHPDDLAAAVLGRPSPSRWLPRPLSSGWRRCLVEQARDVALVGVAAAARLRSRRPAGQGVLPMRSWLAVGFADLSHGLDHAAPGGEFVALEEQLWQPVWRRCRARGPRITHQQRPGAVQAQRAPTR